ncbi:uroporphyrinogen-III synthase [Flagellimonas sp. S174]|uniref:uroporphyrinogen-III synthase n=1 Tax=Flagellimonas sp. S174 TaxID=3410790 RepID=UPI003BF5FCBC
MKTVLSTKILTLPQKELLLNSDIGLVEYDALEITILDFKIPPVINHIIVTSKNGAKAFLKAQSQIEKKSSKAFFNFFCVGEKTKLFLEDSGYPVAEMALSASKLGDLIVSKYKTNRFIFISGNLRREEIPEMLSKNNVQYQEFQGYETTLKKRKFNATFDGYLFFSPSGIKSYLRANTILESPLFCIGKTTAEEAKKYSKNIVVANKPTVENVLVQVIKHFKGK